MAGLRAGFEEVSDDWEGWLGEWSDSTAASAQLWGARVVVQHSTKEELLEVYRTRAALFLVVADDPVLGGLCGVSGQANGQPDLSRLDMADITLATGRGFARRHLGEQPWKPPVNLSSDEQAWADFAAYLSAVGLGEVLDALVESVDGSVSDERFCRAQALMYARAAKYPQDLVGKTHLIDFIRALDLLGSGG